VFERCLRIEIGTNLRHVIWGCFENKIRGHFRGCLRIEFKGDKKTQIQGGRYLNV
jgi:hypothetical protein